MTDFTNLYYPLCLLTSGRMIGRGKTKLPRRKNVGTLILRLTTANSTKTSLFTIGLSRQLGRFPEDDVIS